MDANDVVYATVTAHLATQDGGRFLLHKGSHWPKTDPIVAANPGMFSTDPRWGMFYTEEPDGYRDEAPVEQVTAAPGERREAVKRGPGRPPRNDY